MILLILCIVVLIASVAYDGARDGGNVSTRKRPHSVLPWPWTDLWHRDKRIATWPLWGMVTALMVWEAWPLLWWWTVALVAAVAIACSIAWSEMMERRIREIGTREPWPTRWSKVKGWFRAKKGRGGSDEKD